ncbi:gluconate 2-dehydrogenase subunit 3 family protein [Rhodopila sp.]|uniref:gluconate 2-dehydrogenase subunit 3 family protein n=1 Tax=Rhodopila sp. TaxID=2480087 RepID=UPI003D0F1E94
MPQPRRRELLASTAISLLAAPNVSLGAVVKGALPWTAGQADPPAQVTPGPWQFFTPDEAAAVEAAVDRLIPPDPETPGGKDSGCAVFIDRQLAGPYGRFESHYMKGPFRTGTKEQGDQSPLTPTRYYRMALAALDTHCRTDFAGVVFAKLTDDQKDTVLKGLEDGSLTLQGVDGKQFFSMLLIDTQQGFFADPIYGGNKDMAAWKMIGYPGARYDYRDWVHRHNERYPLPPIGIGDHPNWKL